jgi:cell division protein FtsB
VILLFWVLKENAKREDRLINCLNDLSSKYDTISKDVGEIKDEIKDLVKEVR